MFLESKLPEGATTTALDTRYTVKAAPDRVVGEYPSKAAAIAVASSVVSPMVPWAIAYEGDRETVARARAAGWPAGSIGWYASWRWCDLDGGYVAHHAGI